MHILHVVGARPNFMKAAPVLRALAACGLRQTLVHTGQHYDASMSEVFFKQLGMPQPDVNLGVGSGSHASQTAEILARFEKIVLERQPDVVVVYGDVNSTVAAALVCSKLGIKVAHVEAGLRSRDRSMPEEVNRLVTDQLSDWLFTPSPDGDENLRREGIAPEKIFCVGNVMIDTLVRLLPLAVPPQGLPARYALVTLHRPSNVDDPAWLKSLLGALGDVAEHLPVVFPAHPRTLQRLQAMGIDAATSARLILLEPQPYLQFLALQRDAVLVMSDSGGVQEETTYLGVPCLTVRENTERPITVNLGTNRLVGRNLQALRESVAEVLAGRWRAAQAIPLWDGRAAERIAAVLQSSVV